MAWAHHCAAFFVLLESALLTTLARAEAPSNDERARAATSYDAALAAFDQRDYERAANQFLEADALSPSPDALSNALAAAERAGDPVLAVTVAERVLERPRSPEPITARARRLLGASDDQVAWLVLECDGECEIEIDGTRRAPGRTVVRAGPHLVVARAPGGVQSQRHVDAAGGTEERVSLVLTPALASTPAPMASARPPLVAPLVRRPDRDRDRDRDRTTPRFTFYAGTVLTGALTGATVWSGIDTLRARGRLPGTREETRAVAARARRTDWLLTGTLVAAAVTATIGVVWVEWGGP